MARRFNTRRPVTWAFGVGDASATISATGKTIWTGQISSSGGSALEQTVTRIRGSGRILLKTATAAGDGFTVGLGICLAETTAATLGVTALPGPLTDRDWDGWIWHGFFFVQSVTATIADGVNASSASVAYVIDSKAMRKWDGGAEVLIGMTEVTELGTGSMEHNSDTRVLLKT